MGESQDVRQVAEVDAVSGIALQAETVSAFCAANEFGELFLDLKGIDGVAKGAGM